MKLRVTMRQMCLKLVNDNFSVQVKRLINHSVSLGVSGFVAWGKLFLVIVKLNLNVKII